MRWQVKMASIRVSFLKENAAPIAYDRMVLQANSIWQIAVDTFFKNNNTLIKTLKSTQDRRPFKAKYPLQAVVTR